MCSLFWKERNRRLLKNYECEDEIISNSCLYLSGLGHTLVGMDLILDLWIGQDASKMCSLVLVVLTSFALFLYPLYTPCILLLFLRNHNYLFKINLKKKKKKKEGKTTKHMVYALTTQSICSFMYDLKVKKKHLECKVNYFN